MKRAQNKTSTLTLPQQTNLNISNAFIMMQCCQILYPCSICFKTNSPNFCWAMLHTPAIQLTNTAAVKLVIYTGQVPPTGWSTNAGVAITVTCNTGCVSQWARSTGAIRTCVTSSPAQSIPTGTLPSVCITHCGVGATSNIAVTWTTAILWNPIESRQTLITFVSTYSGLAATQPFCTAHICHGAVRMACTVGTWGIDSVLIEWTAIWIISRRTGTSTNKLITLWAGAGYGKPERKIIIYRRYACTCIWYVWIMCMYTYVDSHQGCQHEDQKFPFYTGHTDHQWHCSCSDTGQLIEMDCCCQLHRQCQVGYQLSCTCTLEVYE